MESLLKRFGGGGNTFEDDSDGDYDDDDDVSDGEREPHKFS